jgi:hypothetical protein
VSIGGPGNDNFIFKPGIGADTIVNFNPLVDTIELDNFTNAQTMQELASLITTSVHGEAVIELENNNSITIPSLLRHIFKHIWKAWCACMVEPLDSDKSQGGAFGTNRKIGS